MSDSEDRLEKVEKLRKRANVTYEAAREALEQSNWDLLDAMVYLEKKGKVTPPETSVVKTDYENQRQYQDELRFGFVIIDSDKRGKGYGKEMIRLGLKFAFEIYGAKRASLGVFENNLSAYYCYKAVGFEDVVPDTAEAYCILGEEWKCKELRMENI